MAEINLKDLRKMLKDDYSIVSSGNGIKLTFNAKTDQKFADGDTLPTASGVTFDSEIRRVPNSKEKELATVTLTGSVVDVLTAADSMGAGKTDVWKAALYSLAKPGVSGGKITLNFDVKGADTLLANAFPNSATVTGSKVTFDDPNEGLEFLIQNQQALRLNQAALSSIIRGVITRNGTPTNLSNPDDIQIEFDTNGLNPDRVQQVLGGGFEPAGDNTIKLHTTLQQLGRDRSLTAEYEAARRALASVDIRKNDDGTYRVEVSGQIDTASAATLKTTLIQGASSEVDQFTAEDIGAILKKVADQKFKLTPSARTFIAEHSSASISGNDITIKKPSWIDDTVVDAAFGSSGATRGFSDADQLQTFIARNNFPIEFKTSGTEHAADKTTLKLSAGSVILSEATLEKQKSHIERQIKATEFELRKLSPADKKKLFGEKGTFSIPDTEVVLDPSDQTLSVEISGNAAVREWFTKKLENRLAGKNEAVKLDTLPLTSDQLELSSSFRDNKIYITRKDGADITSNDPTLALLKKHLNTKDKDSTIVENVAPAKLGSATNDSTYAITVKDPEALEKTLKVLSGLGIVETGKAAGALREKVAKAQPELMNIKDKVTNVEASAATNGRVTLAVSLDKLSDEELEKLDKAKDRLQKEWAQRFEQFGANASSVTWDKANKKLTLEVNEDDAAAASKKIREEYKLQSEATLHASFIEHGGQKCLAVTYDEKPWSRNPEALAKALGVDKSTLIFENDNGNSIWVSNKSAILIPVDSETIGKRLDALEKSDIIDTRNAKFLRAKSERFEKTQTTALKDITTEITAEKGGLGYTAGTITFNLSADNIKDKKEKEAAIKYLAALDGHGPSAERLQKELKEKLAGQLEAYGVTTDDISIYDRNIEIRGISNAEIYDAKLALHKANDVPFSLGVKQSESGVFGFLDSTRKVMDLRINMMNEKAGDGVMKLGAVVCGVALVAACFMTPAGALALIPGVATALGSGGAAAFGVAQGVAAVGAVMTAGGAAFKAMGVHSQKQLVIEQSKSEMANMLGDLYNANKEKIDAEIKEKYKGGVFSKNDALKEKINEVIGGQKHAAGKIVREGMESKTGKTVGSVLAVAALGVSAAVPIAAPIAIACALGAKALYDRSKSLEDGTKSFAEKIQQNREGLAAGMLSRYGLT